MSSELAVGIITFIFSFALILKSSDIFTDGAAKLAKSLGVSDFIIGITVVAFGTSLPELASDSYASFIGHGDIVTGDIIGSNITNIALVLGLTCVLRPLVLKHTEIYSGKIHFLIISIASAFLILNNGIGRTGGILFIIAYILYLRHSIKAYKELGTDTFERDAISKDLLEVVAGLIGIISGGWLLVNSIIKLSISAGISEYTIALLLMAFGTSLPELFVSITAARKGFMTMVLGNIIGSNVANILWVFGIAATIRPIKIAPDMIYTQVFFMLLLSFLLIIFKKSGYTLARKEGAFFLIIYIIFVLTTLVYSNHGGII